MPRLHGFIVSLLIAGGIVAGATAATRTVHLGQASAATPTVADSVVAARRAQLDTFASSLRRADAAKPPALPKIPRFAPVTIPAVPPPPPAAPVLTAAPAPQTVRSEPAKPKTEHVSRLAAAASQAEPPVRYVQPPPVVEYQQAPAQPAAPSGEHEDDAYEQGDSSGYEHESEGD